MHYLLSLLGAVLLFACNNPTTCFSAQPTGQPTLSKKDFTHKNGWSYFLQHLPEKQGPVLDYKGNPIAYQAKQTAAIDCDTGDKDLQQCADVLMRLCAEYLFSQKRFADIHFHFVSGHDCSFLDYCKGKRPAAQGNNVLFVYASAVDSSHQSLRSYLDIVMPTPVRFRQPGKCKTQTTLPLARWPFVRATPGTASSLPTKPSYKTEIKCTSWWKDTHRHKASMYCKT